LLNGFFEALRPVGAVEESFVENLVAIRWRQRRHLIAEAAEIEKGRAFLEWDEMQRTIAEPGNFPRSRHGGGLLREIANVEALDVCLVKLGAMKTRIENQGLDFARDRADLVELYGHLDSGHWQMDLHHWYQRFAETAALPEDVRRQKGLFSPENCKNKLWHDLEEELQKLRWYKDERNSMLCERLELESLCQGIPDSARLDTLMRYATTLDRSFDRTVNQLERAQRIRLGQPVAPRIDVNVSSS
jgi:hypothetical protein